VAIPPVFHWVWLGPEPVPDQHLGWIDGWLAAHPAWRGRVWRDADLPPLRNQAVFDTSPSWAQRADVVRYEILLDHGGVYLDTDMECVLPVGPLLKGVDAFAGEERPGYLGNAILGCRPGHPWMAAVVHALPTAAAERFLVLDQTGPGFLTEVTSGRDDVTVFPSEVFYPFASTDLVRAGSVGPRCHGIHHFEKSWAASECDRICAAAVAALDPLVPDGARFVLVGGGLTIELPRRHAVPFVERDGEDWGPPGDDEQALAELDRQRAAGVQWFAFLPTGAWWLEHYRALAEALRGAARQQREDETIAVFYLP